MCADISRCHLEGAHDAALARPDEAVPELRRELRRPEALPSMQAGVLLQRDVSEGGMEGARQGVRARRRRARSASAEAAVGGGSGETGGRPASDRRCPQARGSPRAEEPRAD